MLQSEWRVEQHYLNDRLGYQMCSRVNPDAIRVTDDYGNSLNTGRNGIQQRAVYSGQTNF